ncbi:integral membrane protein [Tamaricihabitans halophyticus]|uniref:Integral membrane protein n=1 Tax=Tamaricihabitans halophyticus TaxID=1262583 RepID=A0A4R2QH86_9PSEU|nr:DUF3817 domain-containing protein [Tamaricihabitans halophyticus]TCP48613.1 integral membrane protein [Tamaricihabitans halophyticus]
MLSTASGKFRVIAFAEAASWLGLLIGMYVKYLGSGSEIGVKIFGPVHGFLFVAYVLIAIWVAKPLNWNGRMLVLALLASIPPLFTVLFERYATRAGKLSDGETSETTETA